MHVETRTYVVPNDSRAIELDVENVAKVKISELPNHLAGLDIPDLDRTVITAANESSTQWLVR